MSDDGPSGDLMGIVRAVVPDVIRKRFAVKFLIVLLLMGLAIGSVGMFATAQITDQTQERIENEYTSLASQEATIVDQWVIQNRKATKFASNDDVWTSQDTKEMNRAAGNLIRSEPDISEVHVVDTSGDRLRFAASTEFESGETLSGTERDWVGDVTFDTVIGGQVAVSSVYQGADGPVVGFASPPGHATDRVLLVEASVDSLVQRFQGAERAEGGFTQVVDGNGTVLLDERLIGAESRGTELFSTYGDPQARAPIRQALSGDRAAGVSTRMPAQSGILGEEYAVGYAPLSIDSGPQDWVVLVHAPTSEVFGFVQTISEYGLVATGLAVLLMSTIGMALGYNTASSIDRLTSRAEQMEQGDLDVTIRSGRIDNIGRLYAAFASMRDSLQNQISEAEQARKEAEVSRAEAIEMSNYLQERAAEYSETMQRCARGDLTRRMEPEGENESMDQIATDFNEMMSELELTTGQLKTFASQVEAGGRSVQQSAETVRDASEQVADSIQKISDDAYDQKERLQRISEDMDDVAATLESVDGEGDAAYTESLDTVQSIARDLDTAVDLGEETMAESENVAGAAEEQAAELNEVSSRAEELVRYAQYLGDGLGNFETEAEHEFVFQTGAGGTGDSDPVGDAE